MYGYHARTSNAQGVFLDRAGVINVEDYAHRHEVEFLAGIFDLCKTAQ